MYQGDPFIDPEELHELDPVLIAALETQKLAKKERDILMYWTGMQGENLTYLILGIENQTYVDYAMPARALIYNAGQLEKQLKERRRELKQDQYKGCTKSEFLSGFKKNDRLTAVVTIVVYFGQEPWDGPTNLLDMYKEVDERTRKMIPDYPLYLITPDSLTDEDLELFNSGFEQLMLILRDCRNKDTVIEQCSTDPRLQNLNTEVVKVINTVTNLDIEIPEEGGKVNMFEAFIELKEDWMEEIRKAKEKAIEQGIAEGKTQGIAEGRAEGRAEGIAEGSEACTIASIQALTETTNITVQQAMENLKIPLEKREYYLKKVQNSCE